MQTRREAWKNLEDIHLVNTKQGNFTYYLECCVNVCDIKEELKAQYLDASVKDLANSLTDLS